ncbi:MAG: hypothetical protein MK200_08885, partial [Nitrosopumilus sp.]|nr:hypothetical protein [Nitrosopumilus sp.]
KKANRKVKMISAEDISNQNISIDAFIMKMECLDNEYVWTGSFVGEKLKAAGTSCFAIKPTLKEVNGMLTFCFDKQFILLKCGCNI